MDKWVLAPSSAKPFTHSCFDCFDLSLFVVWFFYLGNIEEEALPVCVLELSLNYSQL